MIKKINRVRKDSLKALKRLSRGKGTIKDFELIKQIIGTHFDMLVRFDNQRNGKK